MGKGADIAEWEDELRRSLVTKKALNQPALLKQAQALVQTQLDKEAVMRRRMVSLKAHLERTLAFIQRMILVNVLRVCYQSVTDRPVLPRPYRRRIPKGGVTVLEGARVLARGTRSCT